MIIKVKINDDGDEISLSNRMVFYTTFKEKFGKEIEEIKSMTLMDLMKIGYSMSDISKDKEFDDFLAKIDFEYSAKIAEAVSQLLYPDKKKSEAAKN